MVRITSFSALIAGLLIAVPVLFSDAEAGRAATVATKSDKLSTTLSADRRLSNAFNLVDLCQGATTGDAESWCKASHAEAADISTTELSHASADTIASAP